MTFLHRCLSRSSLASRQRVIGIAEQSFENALEACASVEKNPKISVKAKAQLDALFIQVENTYGKEPVKDREGRYLSSKHKGVGVGLESVRNIAMQYDGMLEIKPEKGCFRVSVLLNVP
ncbi:MAG: ATP-binding protein [Clostridia bacterium]